MRGHSVRGRGRRVTGLTAVIVSLVSVAGQSPVGAATYHSSLGDVRATLSFAGTYSQPRHTFLTITRDGRVVYAHAVASTFCGTTCWPTAPDGSNSSRAIRVVHLRAGEPDVVLDLYSGGAHCCFLAQVFAPVSTARYVRTEFNFGDPVFHLAVLPGSPDAVFVSADDRFAYAFTDFAASGLPLQVLRFTGRGFADVTRRYPAMIRTDAARWLQAFRAQASSRYSDSVGVIAAWTADEYRLGHAGVADAFLHQQAVAGHLHGLLDPALKGLGFVSALEKFLQQRGY